MPQRNARFGESHWSIAHVLTGAHCRKCKNLSAAHVSMQHERGEVQSCRAGVQFAMATVQCGRGQPRGYYIDDKGHQEKVDLKQPAWNPTMAFTRTACLWIMLGPGFRLDMVKHVGWSQCCHLHPFSRYVFASVTLSEIGRALTTRPWVKGTLCKCVSYVGLR